MRNVEFDTFWSNVASPRPISNCIPGQREEANIIQVDNLSISCEKSRYRLSDELCVDIPCRSDHDGCTSKQNPPVQAPNQDIQLPAIWKAHNPPDLLTHREPTPNPREQSPTHSVRTESSIKSIQIKQANNCQALVQSPPNSDEQTSSRDSRSLARPDLPSPRIVNSSKTSPLPLHRPATLIALAASGGGRLSAPSAPPYSQILETGIMQNMDVNPRGQPRSQPASPQPASARCSAANSRSNCDISSCSRPLNVAMGPPDPPRLPDAHAGRAAPESVPGDLSVRVAGRLQSGAELLLDSAAPLPCGGGLVCPAAPRHSPPHPANPLAFAPKSDPRADPSYPVPPPRSLSTDFLSVQSVGTVALTTTATRNSLSLNHSHLPSSFSILLGSFKTLHHSLTLARSFFSLSST